ncbi:DUF418 domain-containing protein [Streptomonospora sp. S1-112]|uniref:DUF418 domain-containing protein n=1 Tax=Streptomonospora mangrovi TaxID=2883123 RepID=A0A9X3SHN1_9ACTN|nr:DUF418 domain-containing protein [Streptomonospora mangrovi]MDA0565484.1 DUF418 domain-containing protein [Streptomonospora mangrovi]
MPPTSVAAPRGAVTAAERSLAPDLARGVMLLVIAVVHAHILHGLAHGGAAPSSAVDTVTSVVVLAFGEGRGYPMFAALFGYGLASIYARRTAQGDSWPTVRSLIRRRGRWLFVFGILHTLLLFFGDILAVYGLIALMFAGMLVRSDRRLLAWGAVWAVGGTGLYTLVNNLLVADVEGDTQVLAHPLTDIVTRAMTWPAMAPLLLVTSVFPFLVGVWAARRNLMTASERNRALLVRTAAIGIPVGVIGGLPYALISAGVWDGGPAAAAVTGWAFMLTGYAGGFGYAALIALIAARMGARRGPVATALAACGERSLTSYLLQSVAWIVLFAPYMLDLAVRVNGTAAVAMGVGVWVATVVLADVLRRAGIRGPAEWVLRRLSYGPRHTARGVAAGQSAAHR